MSMVAIFALSCCDREIVHGRFRGDTMYLPSVAKCPFGCANKLDPRNRPEHVTLKFLRHQEETTLTPELLATNPRLETDSPAWHKKLWLEYHEPWLQAQAAKQAFSQKPGANS